jgi:hypothetical protein
MAEKLSPMNVNEGDPITSELLSNMVANINLINAMASSTTGATGTPGTPGTPGTTLIIDSGRPAVECKTDNTGSLAITFKKTFSVQPNIVCTVWQTSGINFLKEKYLPVVTSASATGFTVRMQNIGATSSGNVYVNWIAVSPS